MAATVAEVTNPMRRQTRGEFMGFRAGIFDITADASYPTSGYPIPAARFGLKVVVGAIPVAGAFLRNATLSVAASAAPSAMAGGTNNLMLMAFNENDGAAYVQRPKLTEYQNAVTLASYSIRYLVFGY